MPWFRKDSKESIDACSIRTANTQSQTTNVTERSVTTVNKNDSVTTRSVTRKTMTHQQTSAQQQTIAVRQSPIGLNTTHYDEFQRKFSKIPPYNSTPQLPSNRSAAALPAPSSSYSNVRSPLAQSNKVQGKITSNTTRTTNNARGPIAQLYRTTPVSNTISSPKTLNSFLSPIQMSDARSFNNATTSTMALTLPARTQPAPIVPSSIGVSESQSQIPRVKSKSNLKPGIAVILNCVDFEKDPKMKRFGSEYDAQLVEETLRQYKIEIKEHLTNPKLKQIEQIVKAVSKKDFTKRACIIFVILSHGSAYDHIAANDGDYDIDKMILHPLLQSSSLRDKPKIFIIQACKGARELMEIQTDATMSNCYAPKEVLKCYSTFEGFVAYRYSTGSPFITALCREIKEKGHHTSLDEIMKSVIITVSKQTKNTQVPSQTSTLTKDFIFGDYV